MCWHTLLGRIWTDGLREIFSSSHWLFYFKVHVEDVYSRPSIAGYNTRTRVSIVILIAFLMFLSLSVHLNSSLPFDLSWPLSFHLYIKILAIIHHFSLCFIRAKKFFIQRFNDRFCILLGPSVLSYRIRKYFFSDPTIQTLSERQRQDKFPLWSKFSITLNDQLKSTCSLCSPDNLKVVSMYIYADLVIWKIN